MKHKIISLMLAAAMLLNLGVSASAGDSTAKSVPVTLTVSNEYRELNVTVPASLPVQVINGKVLTADSAAIVNHSSETAVKVTDITVTKGTFTIGNYDQFSGSGAIALKINGSTTKGEGALTLNESGFPVIEAGKNLSLTYYAKVSGDTENVSNVEAAHVIFTITAE